MGSFTHGDLVPGCLPRSLTGGGILIYFFLSFSVSCFYYYYTRATRYMACATAEGCWMAGLGTRRSTVASYDTCFGVSKAAGSCVVLASHLGVCAEEPDILLHIYLKPCALPCLQSLPYHMHGRLPIRVGQASLPAASRRPLCFLRPFV